LIIKIQYSSHINDAISRTNAAMPETIGSITSNNSVVIVILSLCSFLLYIILAQR